jgi:hypothetical protein
LHLNGRRRDHIAEANVDLDGYSDVSQVGDELEPDPLVVGIFFDPLSVDFLDIERKAVFGEAIRAGLLEDADEPSNIIRSVSEEIHIPCRAMAVCRPEFEKYSTFQHEGVSVFRAAEPKENPLQAVLG